MFDRLRNEPLTNHLLGLPVAGLFFCAIVPDNNVRRGLLLTLHPTSFHLWLGI
jgi:hypothetical protein